jgi:hypothetical protein
MRYNGVFDFVMICIHSKLKTGQPGDVCEQEADIVAEQVMRISSYTINKNHRVCI